MTTLPPFATGVTLVGGGPVTAADLDLALALAPALVAADGGADQAVALGHVPDAVIGDFDSISDAARAAIPDERLHHVAEQDSTDFEKCLTRIAAPFVVAVGFSGGRLDHTLAAMNALVRHVTPPVLLLSDQDVALRCPVHLALTLPIGTRLSLFPMGTVSGRSLGLEWPINAISLAPDGHIGTSNRVTGPVVLDIDGPMLLILPREFIQPLARQLFQGMIRPEQE